MALCCDAQLQDDGTVKGEPTEAALVAYADKLELPKPKLEENFPRVMEAPFDSMRKMMSTVHKSENGYIQYTKGAPDVVLSKCTSYYENGKRSPDVEMLCQLSNYFNKSIDYLITGKEFGNNK